ncbi:tetratricopeptide repeat protein [Desulfococcaceae bacterium HSG8]|nr:tetratricopeptide repeat protein [Desulfococcaceae bacterium HSG8]
MNNNRPLRDLTCKFLPPFLKGGRGGFSGVTNFFLNGKSSQPPLRKGGEFTSCYTTPLTKDLLICLILVITTLAVYVQVKDYEFINFDDDEYVTDNPHVQAGLTRESITWAFTSAHSANWHPLTWLSHMLDVQLYGMSPGQHHLTNLLFHILNTLLLFLVLRQMTGAVWRSAFVAAMFALHPLHAESVAWVSERKDVLSTFFWMLTLWGYSRYAKTPGIITYLPVLIFFTLGLMAKPMLVTLPFVLLLLDYWPLNRISLPPCLLPPAPCSLLLEKIPLFTLSAASSIITFLVQKDAGAVGSPEVYSFKFRIANTLISYVTYIGKMIWPDHLAVYYPYPRVFPWWKAGGAFILFISVSLLAARAVKQHPCFITGWLWYVGTLVPVIGLVQVGAQAMADRYTYIPLIGIFIMIAWGGHEIIRKQRYGKILLMTIPLIILMILMALSWRQVRYWKNSTTLFEHTLEVTSDNHMAHFNLGVALNKQGRISEATKHYTRVLRIKPDHFKAHTSMGDILIRQGKINEAVEHLSQALRLNPRYAGALNNQGIAMMKLGRNEEAIKYLSRALRSNPDLTEAHNNLGVLLFKSGHTDEAIRHFRKALEINPDNTEARNNLEKVLAIQKK